MKMGQPFSLVVRFLQGYNKSVMRKLAIPLTLLLASCGPGSNDPGPGGVSVEDAHALDAAAEKLDTGAIVPVVQQKNQPINVKKQ